MDKTDGQTDGQTDRQTDSELSHIHDDRNFIDRMIFYPYHNA